MNKLTIIGNLTRDPELRTVNTVNGEVSVCDFTVAVNRRQRGQSQNAQNGQSDADFFRVTAWRALGENCAKYLAKGRKVAVVGPVSVRTYTVNDGSTRFSLEVQADDIEFLTSRAEAEAMGSRPAYQPAAQPAPTAQNSGFAPVESDDLPF